MTGGEIRDREKRWTGVEKRGRRRGKERKRERDMK